MNNVRCIRLFRHMTQEELASKSGLSVSTISDLENFKKEKIKMKTMIVLADALNVSIKKLFFL